MWASALHKDLAVVIVVKPQRDERFLFDHRISQIFTRLSEFL
jgi:hypothetical protein